MQAIQTANAPLPAGHYSQAIVHNGLIYVAGQLPIDPRENEQRIGTIEEQTERTLANIAAILEAANSGLDRVLQMTIYISHMDHWGHVNAVYARVMGNHRPARAIVPTRELHHGFQIEIQAIAAERA